MEYRYLGRLGLKVSPFCLGTMNFGAQTSEEDSFAIMDRALELGINFFDTANVYGWQKGEGFTEQIVGRWFAQGGGRREKVVLATKVYGEMGDWPNESRLSALHIRRACDESLRRLQTDRPTRPWPARGDPREDRGWAARERDHAGGARRAPRPDRGLREVLRRPRRAARQRSARVAAREPGRHRADHRASNTRAARRLDACTRAHARRGRNEPARRDLPRPGRSGARGLRLVGHPACRDPVTNVAAQLPRVLVPGLRSRST